MVWLHREQSHSSSSQVPPPLPRKVLRYLVFSHGLGVGSRVLDAGCRNGELVRFFSQLGIEAAGLMESADELRAARQGAPDLEFHTNRPDEGLPLLGRAFDLVLVRDLQAYQRSLGDATTSATTAALLALVRPGGHLVFLSRSVPNGNGELGSHSDGCFRRHLAPFPGGCTTRQFPEGLMYGQLWSRMLGRSSAGGFLIVTFKTPQQRLAPSQWLDLAERSDRSLREPCCRWATRQPQAAGIRKAA